MANFDSANNKINSAYDASNLLQIIHSIYGNCKRAQELLARYQSNTDPVFTGAVNALFTVSERQELGVMLTQINNLATDWETNHSGAIQR